MDIIVTLRHKAPTVILQVTPGRALYIASVPGDVAGEGRSLVEGGEADFHTKKRRTFIFRENELNSSAWRTMWGCRSATRSHMIVEIFHVVHEILMRFHGRSLSPLASFHAALLSFYISTVLNLALFCC